MNIYRTSTVDGRIVSYIINHVINGKIAKVAQGKSVVHVKADEIGKISINYPNKEEQSKIISFLELLDSRIDKQRQLIESLKSYKRGVLSAIFSKKIRFGNSKWESKCLFEVGDIVTGTTPSTSHQEYYGEQYLWVTPSDITSKEIITTSKKLGSTPKVVERFKKKRYNGKEGA